VELGTDSDCKELAIDAVEQIADGVCSWNLTT
jgi:hypothetical protein